MNKDLEDLKQEIRKTIQHNGYYGFYLQYLKSLNNSRNQAMALCPFHDDKTPSLSVNLETGLWNCFSCGSKGDEFNFYMKLKNVTFEKALYRIAADYGIDVRAKANKEPFNIQTVLDYRDTLMERPEQKKYLNEKRGLTDETIRKFHLGYSESLDRYMIPVFDKDKKLINVKRYLSTAKPKCKNALGSKASLFNIAEMLERNKDVFICEGEFDAMLLNQNGFLAISGTSGAGTFKKEWVEYFKYRTVRIIFDTDEAGKTGAQKVASMLLPVAKEVKIIKLPLKQGKDVTDFFLWNGGTKEELERIIKETEPEEKKAVDIEAGSKKEGETNFIKSGNLLAQMCLDPAKTPSTYFCVYEYGKISYRNSLELNGVTHKPYDPDMDAIKNKLVRFPSGAEEYGEEKDLIKDISLFVDKLLDVTPTFRKLIPYYVLFTWVYDLFYELPYLRAKGDFGAGKSRFLKTVGRLCQTPMSVGHCTASYAFRVIERFKGTLILDEADFKESSETEKFIKILNCGFEKDSPYGLTEQKGKKLQEVSYQVFGPKIIATRKEWEDSALESRCLTEDMMWTEREDIPENWKEEFDEEALHLRNKLLLWRFRHYKTPDLSNIKVDKSIEPRLRQIIIPLLSIIDDRDMQEELREHIRERNRDIVLSRGMKFEAIIIEAISKLCVEPIKNKIYMKEIADLVNKDYRDELYEGKDITSRRVGGIVRKKLSFKPIKDMHGSYIPLEDKRVQQRLNHLIQKYGLGAEEKDMTV